MNPAEVRERLAAIENASRDDESAHEMEDGLMSSVLQSIAEGSCEDPAEVARLTLHSADIAFARWCA